MAQLADDVVGSLILAAGAFSVRDPEMRMIGDQAWENGLSREIHLVGSTRAGMNRASGFDRGNAAVSDEYVDMLTRLTAVAVDQSNIVE